MRFMMLVKASEQSEAGVMPTTEQFAEMGKYNEELVKAGVMLAGEGLHPSSKGKRVRFSGDKRTVIDGPFTEAKELVAGFWIWQVKNMDEAVEWVKRMPSEPGAPDEDVDRRALLGLGFGGEWAAGAVLMGETIRAQYRGRAVGSVQSGWAIGWGLAVLSQAVLFFTLPPESAWRWMFVIGAFPALLVFYLRRYVEEPKVAA